MRDDLYFYLRDGVEHGAFSEIGISSLAKSGELEGALVRTARDPVWRTLEEVSVRTHPTAEPPTPKDENEEAADSFGKRILKLAAIALILFGVYSWVNDHRVADKMERTEADAAGSGAEAAADDFASRVAATQAAADANRESGASVAAEAAADDFASRAAATQAAADANRESGASVAAEDKRERPKKPFCELYAERIVGIEPWGEQPPCSNVRATLTGVCRQVEPSLYGPNRGGAVIQLERLAGQYERLSARYSCMMQGAYPSR